METQLTDVTNMVTDNDSSVTFDAGFEIITASGQNIDLSPGGAGEVDVNAPLNTQLSGTPTLAFVDNDTDDKEDTVTVSSNCTATGTGAENCDVTIQQYVGGAPTNVMVADADGAGDARIVLPDSSIGADELMADGQFSGYFLQVTALGDLQWAVGSGGAFDDSSNPVVLNTTTKDVVIGSAQKNSSRLTIDGDSNDIGLTIQLDAAQTADGFVIEDSTGADLFAVQDDGATVIGGTNATITGDGTYVEIDDVLYITPAATPPIACTTNAGIMYHDSSGVICICDGSSSWVEVVDYTGSGACS
jgi:hypothetical protein